MKTYTKANSSRQTYIENNCKFTPHLPGLQAYEAPEDRAGLPALVRRGPCGPLAELSVPYPQTLPVWTIPRPSLSRKVSLDPLPFPFLTLIRSSFTQHYPLDAP